MSSPVREDRDGSTAGVPVGVPTPSLDSYVEKGEVLTASKHEAAPEMSLPFSKEDKVPGRVPG